jgi:hypothetical protein
MRCVASIECSETDAICGVVAPASAMRSIAVRRRSAPGRRRQLGNAPEPIVEVQIFHRPASIGDDREARPLAIRCLEMIRKDRVNRRSYADEPGSPILNSAAKAENEPGDRCQAGLRRLLSRAGGSCSTLRLSLPAALAERLGRYCRRGKGGCCRVKVHQRC